MPKAGSIGKMQSWERGQLCPAEQLAADHALVGPNATRSLDLINIPVSPVGFDLVNYCSTNQRPFAT